MADVTFDGSASLIIVNNGITELDARDIYSWWKQWVINENNANWLPAFSTTGGDPVSATTSISAYYFLINGWRIRSWEGDHFLRIIGNLYAEGGVDSPVVPPLGPYNVLIRSEVSPQSQTISTGIGTADEVADAVWAARVDQFSQQSVGGAMQVLLYGDYIYVDANSGFSGTATFGLGTKARPLNNIRDAVYVADSRNIKKLMILSDITIEAGDNISHKSLETVGTMGVDVTIAPDSTCNAAIFRYMNIQGELTNGDVIQIENCSVFNFERFNGIMNNVAFGQGSEITISDWATIIQATAGGDPLNEPEINVGTASVNLSHITGNIKITNKTGGPRTVVNLTSGNLLIANTCTAGEIQVLGTGIIESDDSGAGCNVDIEGFISIDNIWGTALADHQEPDSTGEALDRIDKNASLIPGTV